jgi:hypothetical protein
MAELLAPPLTVREKLLKAAPDFLKCRHIEGSFDEVVSFTQADGLYRMELKDDDDGQTVILSGKYQGNDIQSWKAPEVKK